MLGPWRLLEPHKDVVLLVSPCVNAELTEASFEVRRVYPDLLRAYRRLDFELGGDPIATLRGGFSHDGSPYYFTWYSDGACMRADNLFDGPTGWAAPLPDAVRALVKRARSPTARRPVPCN